MTRETGKDNDRRNRMKLVYVSASRGLRLLNTNSSEITNEAKEEEI